MGKTVAIIGGGPAGLMAAEILSRDGYVVTVYDRMATMGRKFLMAGRGGLNLTHSEPVDDLLSRYGPARPFLTPAITAFPPAALIAWCENLGEQTFIGTSGRVFPKSFKASPLLRAWLRRLAAQGVTFAPGHDWRGWDDSGALVFANGASVKADAALLALGGASWPKLGSNGAWLSYLPPAVPVAALRPANCGLIVPWSDIFRTRFAGQPLKSISAAYDGVSVPGEMMVTSTGLEGTPAYTLSSRIREDLAAGKSVTLTLDLRPNVSAADLLNKLSVPRKRQSLSTFLQKSTGLAPVAIGLVQELAHAGGIGESPRELATLLKALPLRVTTTAGLDRAISSAGGIVWGAVDDRFMLKALPGVFVAGEMLDWEAPTGGYLLQACFSTGSAAAAGIRSFLGK